MSTDYGDCACHDPHAYKRIQLRRTKGWRKPYGAIVVARPSRWGNPWRVSRSKVFPNMWRVTNPLLGAGYAGRFATKDAAILASVEKYREWISDPGNQDGLPDLAGRDLACWCPLDKPCHADVLLELANGWETT